MHVTVASRAAHLELTRPLTRVRAIDIKLNDGVELARPLQNIESVTPFVLLGHKVQILVLVDNLISSRILLYYRVCGDKRRALCSFVPHLNIESITVVILLNLKKAFALKAFKAWHLIGVLDSLALSRPVILD